MKKLLIIILLLLPLSLYSGISGGFGFRSSLEFQMLFLAGYSTRYLSFGADFAAGGNISDSKIDSEEKWKKGNWSYSDRKRYNQSAIGIHAIFRIPISKRKFVFNLPIYTSLGVYSNTEFQEYADWDNLKHWYVEKRKFNEFYFSVGTGLSFYKWDLVFTLDTSQAFALIGYLRIDRIL